MLEEVAAQRALTRQCNNDGAVFVGFRTGIFERHYAFAVPHLSHNRDKLNLILHDLYDHGTLADLHKTWWWTSRCSRASVSASVLSPLVISALALTAILAWR
jgi:ABC-type amino acid transport substrate-binding protein